MSLVPIKWMKPVSDIGAGCSTPFPTVQFLRSNDLVVIATPVAAAHE
jgi:hypothetical protein